MIESTKERHRHLQLLCLQRQKGIGLRSFLDGIQEGINFHPERAVFNGFITASPRNAIEHGYVLEKRFVEIEQSHGKEAFTVDRNRRAASCKC